MGRSPAQIERTPFAVTGCFTWTGEPEHRWPCGTRKRLSDALDECHRADMAWARIMGGQLSPLRWIVIDERDFTEWQLGIAV